MRERERGGKNREIKGASERKKTFSYMKIEKEREGGAEKYLKNYGS